MQNRWKIDLSIVEQGDIYFFYKPRRGIDKTGGIDDVSRFYLVLQPASTELQRGEPADNQVPRYIVMGGKKMPKLDDGAMPAGRQGKTSWGFVQIVGGRGFATAPRLREKPIPARGASRPAGEGIYAILVHRAHSHLLYSLELPRTLGQVQQAFNIKKEANYIFLERPIARQPLGPDAPYSNFQTIRSTYNLNQRGTEILMVGVGADINRLGIRAETEKETVKSSDIINRLKVNSSRHPLTGIISGNWV